MVKISIIVPIYNAEKYLEQCLQSIKNQTLKDIEVICVDDGSTDSSPQIMDRFQNEDQRFKVIHKSNGGNGHSMNTGLAAATGEYIGCVEADDYIENNMFEKIISIKYDVANNELEKFDDYKHEIDDYYASIMARHA